MLGFSIGVSRGLSRVSGIVAAAFVALVGSVVAPSAEAGLVLTVKPIQICKDDGSDCANASKTLFESESDKIWAQAGISLAYLPWATLNHTAWLDIDVGSGSTLMQEGQDVLDAATGINDTAITNAINVIFANSLDNDPGLFGNGCGGAVFASFCTSRVGVFIGDNVFSYNSGVGRLDTIAHELGHVLNLQHTSVADELMASGSVRNIPGSIGDITPDGAALDKLTDDEIAVATESGYLRDVPEPGTLALALAALSGAMALRRRRA